MSEEKKKYVSPFRSVLKPGFYWAKRLNDLPWELVEVRYKPPTSELEVVTMGWHGKEEIECFVIYEPAELALSDGTPYKGIHQ